MKVEDVMTKNAITVAPGSPLKEVAQTLARHRISGLPVVDDGRVLGVLSEADILEKEAVEQEPGGLRRVLGPDIGQAARLLIERGINRLPVVTEDGRLVGIVTRADLVRAFVRSDEELAHELREDVVVGTLWMDAKELDIRVEDGDVMLSGEIGHKADAELLERFAARVPGVVSVRSELRWRVDKANVYQSGPKVP